MFMFLAVYMITVLSKNIRFLYISEQMLTAFSIFVKSLVWWPFYTKNVSALKVLCGGGLVNKVH